MIENRHSGGIRKILLLTLGILSVGGFLLAVGYKDTPFLPGGEWRVHDSDRPLPPKITPGTASTQDEPGKPPSDAVVLLGADADLGEWQTGNGEPAPWIKKDGYVVASKADIFSKKEFGDVQLHLEWAVPPSEKKDQGRMNSGVFFMNRYEIQILDMHDNVTYADGTPGSIYGQKPPMVLAPREPLQWQTYDILFERPHFSEDGEVLKPAKFTVFHNGVVVQHAAEPIGNTVWRSVGKYHAHGDKAPFRLQHHGDPVMFRNIWVRDLESLLPE